jgi:hypothetical protein
MPTRHISDNTYDSILHNMPAITGNPNVNFELDLYLRVHLIRRDPPGGALSNRVRDWDGIERECSRWTEGEWRLFCRQYKEQVEHFWNDSFILITVPLWEG